LIENLFLLSQFFPALGRKDRNDEVKVAFHQIVCFRKSDFLRHYDQFSEVVSRKRAVIQRTYFCIIAASDNLYKYLLTLFFYRRHKFAKREYLCNSHSFGTTNGDRELKNTDRMHCICTTATVVT